MRDRPSDRDIDPRVEAYLGAELARAEHDAPRPPAIRPPRRSRTGPIVALAVGAVALVLVVAVGGPRLADVATGPSPSASGAVTPTPGSSGLVARPSPDEVTPIERASLSADGLTLTLEFTGGREIVPGDPCTNAYAGWAEAADGVLYAAVVDVTPAPPAGTTVECTAEGYERTVSVTLAAPYTGERVVDIGGGVIFVREPAGLVELRGLPDGWVLRSSGSIERSDIGRWSRVYSPLDPPPLGSVPGRLELIQAFGGPAGVFGGESVAHAGFGDREGLLYHSPASGELVLTWMVGDTGLALVANEVDFTPDNLIALAMSAELPTSPVPSPPGPSPSPTPSPGIPGLLTTPPPGQTVRIDRARLADAGRRLVLEFTAGSPPGTPPDDRCFFEYAGWAEAAGDTLYAAVVDVTTPKHGRGSGCGDIGYGQTMKVRLAAPFTGARLVDIDGYVHFLRAPDGLVQLAALPAGWVLLAEGSVEESLTGRWVRTYSPHATPPFGTSKGRLDLYQSFGGPVNVSGGEIRTTVVVNGTDASLYSSAGYGELVLVFSLGDDGLALVADAEDFSVEQLIELAESAAIPGT